MTIEVVWELRVGGIPEVCIPSGKQFLISLRTHSKILCETFLNLYVPCLIFSAVRENLKFEREV